MKHYRSSNFRTPPPYHWISVSIFVVVLVLFGVIAPSACTNDNGTMHALDSAGYTDIHIGGYSYFGCGSGDTYHTEFTAKNPAGKQVSGIVCCGITKLCTIRF